jgi:hypothetical protein
MKMVKNGRPFTPQYNQLSLLCHQKNEKSPQEACTALVGLIFEPRYAGECHLRLCRPIESLFPISVEHFDRFPGHEDMVARIATEFEISAGWAWSSAGDLALGVGRLAPPFVIVPFNIRLAGLVASAIKDTRCDFASPPRPGLDRETNLRHRRDQAGFRLILEGVFAFISATRASLSAIERSISSRCEK